MSVRRALKNTLYVIFEVLREFLIFARETLKALQYNE